MVPPPPARYAITNGEDTGILNTRSKKGREDFREFISQHHQDIQQLARKYNLSLIQLSTADDVLLELQRNFGNSKRRKPMSSSLDVYSEGKAQASTQEKTPISGGVTSTKSTNASRTSNNSKVA
jgi:activator of HSP90 ATPase